MRAVFGSVKPRVMTPQSSVNFPKTHLKRAKNSAKQHKKRVMRAVLHYHLERFFCTSDADSGGASCRDLDAAQTSLWTHLQSSF